MAQATAESTAAWIADSAILDGRIDFQIVAFDIVDPLEALKNVVESAEIGDSLALVDRNHLAQPWRKVYLCQTEKDQWRLFDMNRVGLDEDGDGCPYSAGFSTESILEDIGMHYYDTWNVVVWRDRGEEARREHEHADMVSVAESLDFLDAVAATPMAPAVHRAAPAAPVVLSAVAKAAAAPVSFSASTVMLPKNVVEYDEEQYNSAYRSIAAELAAEDKEAAELEAADKEAVAEVAATSTYMLRTVDGSINSYFR